jgi:hypothetical protein
MISNAVGLCSVHRLGHMHCSSQSRRCLLTLLQHMNGPMPSPMSLSHIKCIERHSSASSTSSALSALSPSSSSSASHLSSLHHSNHLSWSSHSSWPCTASLIALPGIGQSQPRRLWMCITSQGFLSLSVCGCHLLSPSNALPALRLNDSAASINRSVLEFMKWRRLAPAIISHLFSIFISVILTCPTPLRRLGSALLIDAFSLSSAIRI